MLRISWQTLRARRTTLAGAFVAIWLAVTLAYATGLLMAGALSAPGPGRLAAADAVVRADPTVTVGPGDDAEQVDVVPGAAAPGRGRRARRRGARRRARRRRRRVRGGRLGRARPRAARRRRRPRARPRLAERHADAVPR